MTPLKNTGLSCQDRIDPSPLLSGFSDFSSRPIIARVKKQLLDSVNKEEPLDHKKPKGEEQKEES